MIKNLAVGGGSNRLLLIFALVLGLLAAVLIGVYLSSLNDDGGSSTATTTVPVVVAAQDIPAATTVTQDMVVVKAVPVDIALLGAFTETSAAVGQTTQVALQAGEQFVPSKVASAGTAVDQFGLNPPASVLIPEGSRGFSIALSAVGAAGGLVRPGDYIDVLMSTPGVTDANGVTPPASSCYVLQNVGVLAIGETLSKTTSQTDANGIAAVANDPAASTMTLSVSPAQAGILVAAQQSLSGSGVGNPLWVSLRKFSDHGTATDVATCSLASTPTS